MTIQLKNAVAKDEEINLYVRFVLRLCHLKVLTRSKIHVNTTDNCTALQWLEPEQTPNKKNPYMCKRDAVLDNAQTKLL